MGLFDCLKVDKKANVDGQHDGIHNSVDSFADSSSISADERSFYQPDNYYTYYSYPGTELAVRVVTFEERKRTTYPSARGLYVGEIMLLSYCTQGKYPKPNGGYPGFWWFKYGIRDIGHALESLENRGFVKWASKHANLRGIKVDELKKILNDVGLPVTGKKEDLIHRIEENISEDRINIPNYFPKYDLTDLGNKELNDNGYVPYMHKHSHLTTEDDRLGTTFTVWDINRLFPDGHAENWKQVVGKIEKERFGVDMADAIPKENHPVNEKKADLVSKEEMRNFLASKKNEISSEIKKGGDGFADESQGIDYKATGNDQEALVKFYIAIGKQFDAPALYRETAVLLRKYGMYDEELSVINAGLMNVPKSNKHRLELFERKKKVQEFIKKNKVKKK